MAKETAGDTHGGPRLQAIWNAQGGRCALTGSRLIPGDRRVSLDHIVPQAHGGGHETGNLRWVTLAANRAKSDMTDAQLLKMCRQVVATLGAASRKNTECPPIPTLFAETDLAI